LPAIYWIIPEFVPEKIGARLRLPGFRIIAIGRGWAARVAGSPPTSIPSGREIRTQRRRQQGVGPSKAEPGDDVIGRDDAWETSLIGDMFYEPAFDRKACGRGCPTEQTRRRQILVGDAGRKPSGRARMEN